MRQIPVSMKQASWQKKRHVFHFIAVYFNIFQWFLHLVSSFSFRQNFPLVILVLVFALAWFGLQPFVVSLRLLARHLVCFGATTEDPPSPTNVLHVWNTFGTRFSQEPWRRRKSWFSFAWVLSVAPSSCNPMMKKPKRMKFRPSQDAESIWKQRGTQR
jgi:hypothetical protein